MCSMTVRAPRDGDHVVVPRELGIPDCLWDNTLRAAQAQLRVKGETQSQGRKAVRRESMIEVPFYQEMPK